MLKYSAFGFLRHLENHLAPTIKMPVLFCYLAGMTAIVKATAADTSLIVRVATASFIALHENRMPATDLAAYVSTKLTIPVIEEELNNPANIFHIIYYNDQPAGYSKIIFNTPCPLIKNTAVTKMERLYLLKEFYALQLGSVVFEFNNHLARQANQAGMWLYVWVKNERAIRFYKKQGFEIIGNEDFVISPTLSNPNHIMYLGY